MSFETFEKTLPQRDLWQYLSDCDKPVVMYGMGNGADKIIKQLDLISVEIKDFFASDEFVRGQSFHGKVVHKFEQIKEKYSDFIILVSFGSEREDVINKIISLDKEYELYLPDVPVAGDDLFNIEFYKNNRSRIKEAYEKFADDESRRVFEDVIMYKLTGKINYLFKHTHSDVEVYKKLYDTELWHTCADLGAYDGDSVFTILECAPDIEKIIAIEPDPKNFRKLVKNIQNVSVFVEAHNVCAYSEKTELAFDRGGNRNSSVSTIGHTPSVGDTKSIIINADRLDNIVADRKVDFIKIDVEGCELEAIRGAYATIAKCRPDLLVSAYHKSEDLFELPLEISSLVPAHKIYLRRKRCLPAWEISLCAIKA